MGRKAGGADIYGYKTNEDGEYVPNPDEAKTVQLIYELAAKEYTLRQISAELHRRGIRTKWGRERWSVTVLGNVLRNDIYLGIYRFHKSKHGKDVDGSRYTIRRQDNIVVGTRDKPNHPPLVDRRTFELVQLKIAANRKKNSVRLYMGTGLLRCPVCGTPMHVKYSSASGYRTDKVRAAKYTCSKRPGCSQPRLLISEINDRLWGALVELFVRPERIHELIATSPKNDLDTLQKELASAEREQRS